MIGSRTARPRRPQALLLPGVLRARLPGVCDGEFMRRAERYRLPALAVGSALAVWWVLGGDAAARLDARPLGAAAALTFLGALASWMVIVGLLGYGRRYLDRTSPALVLPGRGLVSRLHPAPDGDRGRRLVHRRPGRRRSRCSGSPCSWSRWSAPSRSTRWCAASRRTRFLFGMRPLERHAPGEGGQERAELAAAPARLRRHAFLSRVAGGGLPAPSGTPPRSACPPPARGQVGAGAQRTGGLAGDPERHHRALLPWVPAGRLRSRSATP